MLEKSGSWLGTSPAGQMLVGATAGGIAAELGGGKFLNGAVTAGFVYLFNEGMHKNYIVRQGGLAVAEMDNLPSFMDDPIVRAEIEKAWCESNPNAINLVYK